MQPRKSANITPTEYSITIPSNALHFDDDGEFHLRVKIDTGGTDIQPIFRIYSAEMQVMYDCARKVEVFIPSSSNYLVCPVPHTLAIEEGGRVRIATSRFTNATFYIEGTAKLHSTQPENMNLRDADTTDTDYSGATTVVAISSFTNSADVERKRSASFLPTTDHRFFMAFDEGPSSTADGLDIGFPTFILVEVTE